MIKHFLKIFFSTVILFVMLFGTVSFGYMLLIDKNIVIGTVKNVNTQTNVVKSNPLFDNTPFGKTLATSNRINVLVVGLEGQRTDTIMVASYDQETKEADLISIPRDTYYPREGYERADTKKINSVYSADGVEGLMTAAQTILGIPVDRYVIFDYAGVIACVDAMGGVEVDVPFRMQYDDPYDTPPLHIDIPAGLQVLDGQKALEFLRYRKGYDNQDLGRINAQQQFVKSAMKKVLSFKLPLILKEVYSSVKTNFSLKELIGLADDVVGFSPDNLKTYTLPGQDTPLEGLSFYIANEIEIKKLVYQLYDMPVEDQQTPPPVTE